MSVDACTHEEMLTCAARESEARPQLADDGTEGKRLAQRGEEVERERKRIREVSARQDIAVPSSRRPTRAMVFGCEWLLPIVIPRIRGSVDRHGVRTSEGGLCASEAAPDWLGV